MSEYFKPIERPGCGTGKQAGSLGNEAWAELREDIGKESGGIEEVLEERGKTHGDFCTHAYATQLIKGVYYLADNWDDMTASQKESLEMIAHKIGRILSGDPDHKDHWVDIAGYAMLVGKELE